jgi:hypothetical protein
MSRWGLGRSSTATIVALPSVVASHGVISTEGVAFRTLVQLVDVHNDTARCNNHIAGAWRRRQQRREERAGEALVGGAVAPAAHSDLIKENMLAVKMAKNAALAAEGRAPPVVRSKPEFLTAVWFTSSNPIAGETAGEST